MASSDNADLADFIAAQSSVFLATASAEGSLYPASRWTGRLSACAGRQDHRLRDFAGNRQYITQGQFWRKTQRPSCS